MAALASTPYPFPLDGRLRPNTTALLCVDMQGDFCRPGGFMDGLGLAYEELRAALPGAGAPPGPIRGGGGAPVAPTANS